MIDGLFASTSPVGVGGWLPSGWGCREQGLYFLVRGLSMDEENQSKLSRSRRQSTMAFPLKDTRKAGADAALLATRKGN